jgi:hypothetical protein
VRMERESISVFFSYVKSMIIGISYMNCSSIIARDHGTQMSPSRAYLTNSPFHVCFYTRTFVSIRHS